MKKSMVGILAGGALVLSSMGCALWMAQQGARPPQARLDHVMQLNRAGDWREAAREAEAIATLADLPVELRAQALFSAAYARLRLHDEAAAARHLTALESTASPLADTHWIRREAGRLRAELTDPVAGTLRRAMQGNRTGDWAGARQAAEAVLARPEAGAAARGEAGYHAAWAALRGGDRPAADRFMTQAEAAVAGLPANHWLHQRLPGLRSEIDR